MCGRTLERVAGLFFVAVAQAGPCLVEQMNGGRIVVDRVFCIGQCGSRLARREFHQSSGIEEGTAGPGLCNGTVNERTGFVQVLFP